MPRRPEQILQEAAEESWGDFSGFVRLGLWGGAAAAALLIVALATRTDIGNQRIAGAYASITGAPQTTLENQRIATEQTRQLEQEARRLADSLRTLSDDRDRIVARMTALERNYEDVTGSISKLSAGASGRPQSDMTSLPSLPPIDAAPVATIPAIAPDRPAAAAPPAPEPGDGVSARSEFGVDIGGGATLAPLRAAWNQIRRTHGTLLEGLRPVVGVREGRNGQVELRLVVGPIGNAASAAKLCASLAAAGLSCQPTMYEGQRLAAR